MRLLTRSSLILLCYALGAALGGGLYESIVLVPLWSKSPPSRPSPSFSREQVCR